jgi:hypothetical protein
MGPGVRRDDSGGVRFECGRSQLGLRTSTDLRFQTARCVQPQLRDLAAHAREFILNVQPSWDQRVQGKPDAQCTRSLACEVIKHTSVVTAGSPEKPGLPCAMVYGLFRALPGDRALLPPSLTSVPANLTPASGCQDYTTSPSAGRRLRLKRRLRPPHPAPRP